MSEMPLNEADWYDLPLTVAEVYDRLTIQGEGPTVGRPCTFVRLGLCNLTCSWCDTPFTWDWNGLNGVAYDRKKELKRTTVRDVLERVLDTDARRLVITGGEPMLQKRAVLALAWLAAAEHDLAVEIETNGTLLPHDEWPDELEAVARDLPDGWLRWNVSPKLAHSGMPYETRVDEEALTWYADQPNSALKFVCRNAEDVAEAAALVKRVQTLGARFGESRVWIMPEGIDTETLNRHTAAVVDAALAHGFNITPRLHVQLWGNVRGR